MPQALTIWIWKKWEMKKGEKAKISPAAIPPATLFVKCRVGEKKS